MSTVSATKPNKNKSRYERDATYYLPNIVFLVEDRLFCVPRRIFVDHSVVFRQMFEMPSPPDVPVDGSSDDQPLNLEGVSAAAFKCLLRVLLPMRGRKGPAPVLKTFDEWYSVLQLAAMWELAFVRDAAVAAIGAMNMGAVETIFLSREYAVPEWLEPALAEIAVRKAPLSADEGQVLGLDWTLKVAALREVVAKDWMLVQRQSAGSGNGQRQKYSRNGTLRLSSGELHLPTTVLERVRQMFRSELCAAGPSGK